MCKKNMFDIVGSKMNPGDLCGLQMRVKVRPEIDDNAMPPDLSALLGLIMHGLVPHDVMKNIEKPEVKTFGEPVKLKNGKWGLKISRADEFIMSRPVKVLDISGREFGFLGFIRKSRKEKPFWIMTNGQWFNDDYFYIECEEPRVKMTLAEIEEKLGFKVEIVE